MCVFGRLLRLGSPLCIKRNPTVWFSSCPVLVSSKAAALTLLVQASVIFLCTKPSVVTLGERPLLTQPSCYPPFLRACYWKSCCSRDFSFRRGIFWPQTSGMSNSPDTTSAPVQDREFCLGWTNSTHFSGCQRNTTSHNEMGYFSSALPSKAASFALSLFELNTDQSHEF